MLYLRNQQLPTQWFEAPEEENAGYRKQWKAVPRGCCQHTAPLPDEVHREPDEQNFDCLPPQSEEDHTDEWEPPRAREDGDASDECNGDTHVMYCR